MIYKHMADQQLKNGYTGYAKFYGMKNKYRKIKAKQLPLHKANSRQVCSNSRGISLLNIAGKNAPSV